jgi:Tfp pilus assembly protein PilF
MSFRGEKYPAGVLIAYYLTLAAFFVASFFPHYRVWGISWWAYFPLWIRFGLLALGAVAPFVADRLIDKLLAGRDDITSKMYLWLVGGFAVTMTALFYLLRARTHFLGDGYTLLSLLGSENPFIKPRNLGGTIFQYWIFKLIGGGGEDTALLAYQIVSFGAGVLFLVIVIWSAAKLLPNRLNRLLFVLAVSSGGYMLLFFGYVENYSLFSVAVFTYAVLILLISSDRVNRLWIVPVQITAVFLHIFGVALVPATLYILMSGTRMSNSVNQLKWPVKIGLGLFATIAAFAVFFYAYSQSFFFRLSLLPILENEFTVEGYTLFSINHLLDLASLILILIPGIAIGLLAVIRLRRHDLPRFNWFPAAALTIGGTLGTALIFSPGLGMPRDWDLFAFTGVPLVLFLVILMISWCPALVDSRRALFLTVVLSSLALFSRAAVISSPDCAVAATIDYISLDRLKSASARFLVIQHFDLLGDKQTLIRLKSNWDTDLMTKAMERETVDLMNEGRMAEALPKLRRFVAIRPNTYSAWDHLGQYFCLTGQLDSALEYLRIANGLNPYNAGVLCNIGIVCGRLNRLDEARDYFEESLRTDSMFAPAIQGLVRTYREQGDTTRYLAFLKRIAARPSPPLAIWDELIGHYLRTGRNNDAADALRQGIAKGLDTAHARSILELYPQLRSR